MANVSQTIPNLLGGVSQQPADVRPATQAEVQTNLYVSPVDGLVQMPATQHIAQIGTTAKSDALIHWINRDATERYSVQLRGDGTVAVSDLDGNAKTIIYEGSATAYLTQSGAARDNFALVTVADYTFIVNKQKTVAMAAAEARHDTNYNYSALYCKASSAGLPHDVYVNGWLVPWTPGGISTRQLAIDIAIQINASSGTHGCVAASWGNLVVLYKASGSGPVPPEVVVYDGNGNNNLIVITPEVQRFSDLPPNHLHYNIIKVTGADANPDGDYYVWSAHTSALPSGLFVGDIWKETYFGGEPGGPVRGFDASTMPHILVRNPGGTFTCKPATWDKRNVGDSTSVPHPSFVGQQIKDVFFHRNRLGFLAGDNVVLSRAGEFFNFWPASARELVDDDPIDTSVSHNKSTLLQYAVPFDRALMLFSDQAQFVLTADSALTNETARIDVATDYETTLKCHPVAAGEHCYFASERGPYAGLWEYFVNEQASSTAATDVSQHVPQFIPAGVHQIIASVNDDFVGLLTTGDPSSIYVYKMAFNGTEKVLSSWGKWTLDSESTILSGTIISGTLYLAVSRATTNKVMTEKIELVSNATAVTECGYSPHMLRRVRLTSGTYDAGNNWTTWTLPYSTAGTPTMFVVLSNAFSGKKGAALVATQPAANTVRVNGNYASGAVYIGLGRTYTYTFSPFHVRQQREGGASAVRDGRLQLRKLFLSCGPTGYLRVDVTVGSLATKTYHFGYQVGVSVVSQPTIEDRVYRVPTLGRSDKVSISVTSDSPLPLSLLSATWHGEFTKKGQAL